MPLDSSFQWMTIDEVTSSTATGSIVGGTGANNVTCSITHSNGGMGEHDGIYNYQFFPAEYNVPGPGSAVIQNVNAGVFTATFSKPVVNALVVFGSVGSGWESVPVEVSQPFTPIWTLEDALVGETTYQNPVNATQYTQFTGSEGYNIIRIDGSVTEVSFTYTVSEYYCTICFGFVNQNDPAIQSFFCDPRFDRWATALESGCNRFRRLRLLGYI